MKAPKFKFSVLLAGFFAFAGIAQAQEYDDMYFNKKDRKAKVENQMSINKNLPSAQTEETTEYVMKNENTFSEEHVNPEYLARYGNNGSANGQYAEDEYYTEGGNAGDDYQVPVVNNYYYNMGAGYNGVGFYDPFFNPWMTGWNNPWVRSSWNFSVNFGFGWGNFGGWNPWRFGPSWGWNSWYGPSWGMGWGWNSWYGPSWNVGWGYGWGNAWAWNGGWGWGSPYWGYPGNVIIINDYESRYNRTFRRGSGPSRSSVAQRRDGTSNTDRFTDQTGTTYGRAGNASRVASSTATRRYIDPNNSVSRSNRVTQGDYYRRSQMGSRTVSNGVTSSRSTAYNTSRSGAASRSSAYSSPGSNYSTRTRGSSSYGGQRNMDYRSGSSSRSSFNTPASRNSYRTNSSGRGYTPSRSSGSYNRSSSGSTGRSMGSFSTGGSSRGSSGGSISTGGGSRSSGSSGGSRSSGSSGSRRGN